MILPLAITRDDVAEYVSALLLVYMVLILLNVLIGWIPRMPYYRALRATLDFIKETTDPYLGFFRRFLPPIGGGGFALDLSPIVGLIVLGILRGILVALIRG